MVKNDSIENQWIEPFLVLNECVYKMERAKNERRREYNIIVCWLLAALLSVNFDIVL